MQVTETLSDGLKRELEIVIPASELDQRLNQRLEELKEQIQIKGFRPGKVPMAHMRSNYTARVMPEILEKAVTEISQKALKDRDERPALQPQIKFPEDREIMDKVIKAETDLAFTMTFEVIPSFEVTDFSALKLVRPVAAVTDTDINDALDKLKSQNQTFEPRDAGAKAVDGDQLTIDFTGSIDGEEFDGGKAEDAQLVLGSGSFIPGFEEQLTGAKAGDTPSIKVTFPDDYNSTELAGKKAVFAITVSQVAGPAEITLDDAFATGLGMDSMDKLKDAVRQQIESEFTQMSRIKLKRRLLDALDNTHAFDLPPTMVESEFEGIWKSVEQDLERAKKTFKDEGTTEEKARQEYQTIAERRVRLGLVIADVGDKNEITISEDEVNRAVMERVRQFPGQEKEAFEFFKKNPQAVAELRAPIFEDKVVDYIFELASITEESMSREELFAEEDDDDAAAETSPKKKAKKSPKKKA
ncbi:MAG: trigger factor [Alphaproteobacteria bacterium]